MNTRTQFRADMATVPQLLRAARNDTDPVSVFVVGSDRQNAKESIFVVKDATVAGYIEDLLRRQRLVTDKPVGQAPDVDVANPATCAACGCTDRRACKGGCYWLGVDRTAKSGICSNCQPALQAWRNQRAEK